MKWRACLLGGSEPTRACAEESGPPYSDMARLRLHGLKLSYFNSRKPDRACAGKLSGILQKCSPTASRMDGVCGLKTLDNVNLRPPVWHALLYRRLSAAVDVEDELHSQCRFTMTEECATACVEGLKVVMSEKTTLENAADEMLAEAAQKKNLPLKQKLTPETAVQKFFDRMNLVAQVVSQMKTTEWGEELQASLKCFLTGSDMQMVNEVLRADIPCDYALSFFKWLKCLDNFKHNENSYGVMLNVLGLAGRVDEMKELYSEMVSEGCKPTAATTSNVMLFLSRTGDFEQVEQHFQSLKHGGVSPSLGVYNAYLDMLVRKGDYETLAHVYKNMLAEKSLPNARTFTLFIEHLVHFGKHDAALEIMRIMKKAHEVASRVTYELLLFGYAKAGNIDMVQDLLIEMREHFHKPSKHLLPVVRALQNAGKAAEAVTLYRDIGSSWQADSIDEIKNLDDHLKNENVSDAFIGEDFLINEWRAAAQTQVGFDVNGFACALHSWNTSVEEVLEKTDVQWHSSLIYELLRRLRSLETSWPFFLWVKRKPGYKPDIYCCMQMIQRVLKAEVPLQKKGSLLNDLFEEFKQDGVKLCAPMFNMVLRYYISVKELEKAVDMFDSMKVNNVEPNKASYTAVIYALARDRKCSRAMDKLAEMEQAGFQPEISTNAELITCLALSDRLQDACKLFDKILASGRSLSSLEYKAMIASYHRAGDQKNALALYDEMRQANMRISQDMYDIVTAVLRKDNRTIDIQMIEKDRSTLTYFDGRKKEYQEHVLEAMHLFVRNMKKKKAKRMQTR